MRLPGLVDVHVHLRQPGGEHKEDWTSGTAAALAGGITTVLAMPNTHPPVVDRASFDATTQLAAAGAVCDYALFVGASSENVESAAEMAAGAAGLKMYLNDTYGELRLDRAADWPRHLEAWPLSRPVVAHAEGETAAAIIDAARLVGRPIHICHVSSRFEIELIADAKNSGTDVTCEVAPHHLFLTEKDSPAIGDRRAIVRPPLGTEDDQRALWEHLDVIDCFATDHAPHLAAEKDSAEPPPGFPGLETVLPLLLDAVHREQLTVDDVIRRMHDRPTEIFGLPTDETTFVEVDEDHAWTISAYAMFSKARWTPFEGRRVRGRVRRVVLRGEEAYKDGVITARPGTGRAIRTENR
ncbi:MAG: amidohydrolase family protein [Acidimicrobiia bacterium]|nr:amidohydrolase family protein [Acidimicrobiia bacterium]